MKLQMTLNTWDVGKMSICELVKLGEADPFCFTKILLGMLTKKYSVNKAEVRTEI